MDYKAKKIKLVLEDGTMFSGKSFGYEESVSGEIVFNTAMTGYPESLTDPSYKGQILTLTYPIVGNYGVPRNILENGLSKNFESDKVHISGLVISDYSFEYNQWNAEKSLSDWLKESKVPGIYGVDTRALTKYLREKGVALGKIIYDDDIELIDPNKKNLVDMVSIKDKKIYGNGKYKILLIDCGVKYNIIRYLLNMDTTVIRVPWNYDYSEEEFDGLFLSNGPGDPEMCSITINHLKKSIDMDDRPIFGICLGHQLLGLAAGARTFKLPYGHRSHNQPVLHVGTNKAYITSQNHGFAIDDNSIPDEYESYFVNLNDNSNEGLKHKSRPIFSSQFHPEAAGGPTDTEFLFHQFMDNVKAWKEK